MAGFNTNMRVGKRKLHIQVPQEAVQEFLPVDSLAKSASDRGKPVTFAGSDMDICADGDEIVGFVEGVELPWRDGRIPFGCRDRGTVLALDEAGSLAVGDLVVAGTQEVAGTHPITTNGTNVAGGDPAGRVRVGATAPTIHKWVVWEVYGTGVDRPVLLRRA